MKVLQVHCAYQYQGGEDSVVASERSLLQQRGVIVEELIFNNNGNTLQKILQAPFNLGAYFLTVRKLKKFRPDIVHIHNLHFAASPSVIFAIQKSSIPFIQTLHNFRLLCPSAVLYHRGKLFLHSLHQRFPWSAVFAGVYRNSRALTGWVAFSVKFHQWIGTWKKASRYIVLTRHAEKLFLSSGIGFKSDQLMIKPNFSAPARMPAGVPGDHFVFVGRLSEEKGIMLLLKAFASLPYKIKIAGDGPLLADVLDYSRKYPNIEYAGSITREAVFPFLAAGAALIFPSEWYEGMPMVIIEAFACGLPVIASCLGAMEEMITSGYNGFHFKAGKVDDLQRAVAAFTNLSQKEKTAYHENAYLTYTNNYTPEKNADQLLNIYNDVINTDPSSVSS